MVTFFLQINWNNVALHKGCNFLTLFVVVGNGKDNSTPNSCQHCHCTSIKRTIHWVVHNYFMLLWKLWRLLTNHFSCCVQSKFCDDYYRIVFVISWSHFWLQTVASIDILQSWCVDLTTFHYSVTFLLIQRVIGTVFIFTQLDWRLFLTFIINFNYFS